MSQVLVNEGHVAIDAQQRNELHKIEKERVSTEFILQRAKCVRNSLSCTSCELCAIIGIRVGLFYRKFARFDDESAIKLVARDILTRFLLSNRLESRLQVFADKFIDT